MYITIGCIDGKEYTGDDIPESVIQEEIDKVDGRIGTGDLAHIRIDSIDEFCAFMSDMVGEGKVPGESDFKVKTITLTIGGIDRVFRQKSIVWHEIHRDEN